MSLQCYIKPHEGTRRVFFLWDLIVVWPLFLKELKCPRVSAPLNMSSYWHLVFVFAFIQPNIHRWLIYLTLSLLSSPLWPFFHFNDSNDFNDLSFSNVITAGDTVFYFYLCPAGKGHHHWTFFFLKKKDFTGSKDFFVCIGDFSKWTVVSFHTEN